MHALYVPTDSVTNRGHVQQLLRAISRVSSLGNVVHTFKIGPKVLGEAQCHLSMPIFLLSHWVGTVLQTKRETYTLGLFRVEGLTPAPTLLLPHMIPNKHEQLTFTFYFCFNFKTSLPHTPPRSALVVNLGYFVLRILKILKHPLHNTVHYKGRK